jgi:hypothetical protein
LIGGIFIPFEAQKLPFLKKEGDSHYFQGLDQGLDHLELIGVLLCD